MPITLEKIDKINGQKFNQEDVAKIDNNMKIIQDTINNGTSLITEEDRENLNKIRDIESTISNVETITPAVGYGMNNVIKYTGKTPTYPRFTIKGRTLINILGRDGNCEDVSKWSLNLCSASLDSTNKVFGSNGIKITISSTAGYFQKLISSTTIDTSKYYLFSAYLKNGNASYIRLHKNQVGGGNALWSTSVTDTTKFNRVGLLIQPSDFGNGDVVATYVNGTSGQYAYVDGIMVNEITTAEYALGATALLDKYPYVDSYTCLQNPYIEVRKNNLVRNGNGEEGISWWSEANNGGSFTIENGYTKLNFDGVQRFFRINNNIPVRSNTSYSYRVIVKRGTHVNGLRMYINEFSDANLPALSILIDTTVTSTNDTVLTGTFTVSSTTKLIKLVFTDPTTGASSGTNYVKEIMLVEGATPPTEYKSCEIQRTVIEGQFADGDDFVFENGKVEGLNHVKHKTLYGKDYDWQFKTDYTGYKTIMIPSFRIPVTQEIAYLGSLVKYDGKIIPYDGTASKSDTFIDYYTGSTYPGNLAIALSDTDTGWTETINPNNDESKLIMNGWKAVMGTVSSRYVFWVSIVDGSLPSGAANSTTSTTNASTTSIVVADGTKFSVGDYIVVVKSGVPTYCTNITAISTNTLTLGSTVNVANGDIIALADNGTKTNLLTWCKNNVAPGFEGYRLHYKLANPEPMTDVTVHVDGDSPTLSEGDNYIYLDAGIVLGETSPVAYNDGANVFFNSNAVTGGFLKNKVEIINSIFKNNIQDTKWTYTYSPSYPRGNGYIGTPVANFDTTATYTVDYKIIATQAPNIGTLECSYGKSITEVIENLAGEVGNRQLKDSALDAIVDLSMYEKIIQTGVTSMSWWGTSTSISLRTFIPFTVIKKATPIITLDSYTIITGSASSGNITINNNLSISSVIINKTGVYITFTTADATVISNAKSYGVVGMFNVTADCRGRM